MKMEQCAYCGSSVTKLDKEHVFPKCLYPKRPSNVNRLTIPACNKCNNSWSDDEAHFRNILVLAGKEPNAARQKLWETTTLRSFHKLDGSRRLGDVLEKMKAINTTDGTRYMIFPGKDERVLRVVRKIVRGLCYHHGVLDTVSDQRVWADTLKYTVPDEFLDQMQYDHREQDIAEYRYQTLNEKDINSVWLITIFEKITFIGLVSESEDGFDD